MSSGLSDAFMPGASTTVLPSPSAKSTRPSMNPTGTSITTITFELATVSLTSARSTWSLPNIVRAPWNDIIMFSPVPSSTTTNALPEGSPSMTNRPLTSTPSFWSPLSSLLPSSSSPTALITAPSSLPRILVTAVATFAAFPPGNSSTLTALTPIPGRGNPLESISVSQLLAPAAATDVKPPHPPPCP
jgi:hypothetical protein